ncbi:MAG: T9SS type A sorting domain-containing protein [candidate division Zixibacteria bacterium]|nr:T9SS type A sorting domain-containing protein [candidate division Zixibacteria bacterium]
MKLLKVGLLLVILLALTSTVPAATSTFDNSWGDAGFNLMNQDLSGIEVVYSIKKMAINEIDINGQIQSNIHIPGIMLPNNAGAPNLPGSGRSIAVPYGASVTYEIIDSEIEIIDNIDVAPASAIPFDNDDSPPVYEKDPSIYSVDANYPENPVMLSEVLQMRGVDYIVMGITPFQYNPATKQLIVYKNLRIRVNFIGGNGHIGDDRLRSRFWEPVLKGNLINYQSLPKIDFTYTPSDITDEVGYEYVIIVPDDETFIAWADTIRNWRTLQGIKTGVFTLSEIGGNSTAAIENFVNNAYSGWDIPPAAVLLLSDYQNTGLSYGITSPMWDNYCVSDNIYADIDNNDLPDIAFARITAQTNSHLSRMINKFLDYERNPPMDPDFYNTPIIAGGWQDERWFILCDEICYGYLHNELGKVPVREYAIYDGYPGSQWSTNQNTHMLVDYFGPDGLGYIPQTPQHLDDWGANAGRLNNDINAGAFMLMHRDHGGETGWGEPDYDIGDLYGLNNQYLPFVFSINCLTGKYNFNTPCFTEAFHRMEDGALGLTAASETSYSFVNDTYIFGLMDYLWPNFDPGYGENGEPLLNPCFANVNGKYFLQSSSWPYNPQHKVYTHHLFHHHGDAFITMNSEVPQRPSVIVPNIHYSGFNTLGMYATEGALVGITVDGEIIGTAIGIGAPQLIPVEPQPPGKIVTITVTKPNYKRYAISIPTVPPDGYGVVEGYITDMVTGYGLEGIVTVIDREPPIVTECDDEGFYSMYIPADSTWLLKAEYTTDYGSRLSSVSVSVDDTTTRDMSLEPKTETILKASFGNPDDVAYKIFYYKGSWDDEGNHNYQWTESFSPMRDDGVAPDEYAGDGIFTGSILLMTDQENSYSWAVYSECYNGDASKLQDGLDFDINYIGSPPDVPVLEVNPTGLEHNWTLNVEDISGAEFDLVPGYDGNPNLWYGSTFMYTGITYQYRIKAMRSDNIFYGADGVGGERIVFAPEVSGNYTVYFNDDDDLVSTGAELTILPEWLEVTTTPGNTTSREITLTNSGVLDLHYSIPDEFEVDGLNDNGGLLPELEPYKSFEYTGPKPKMVDSPPGPPVSTGQGGPDNYGYKWIDSDEPNGPAFNWIDITGIGTPVNMSDDDNEGPFSLPFTFNFYGNDYNSFRICSNGWMSFTSTATTYSNTSLPSSSAPENLIAPMFDDLNPSQGGQVYYYTDSDSAIVSWVEVPHYNNAGSYTFQIILYSGGMIKYNYLSMIGELNSATLGIQNSSRNDGLLIAYNTNYIHDELSVKISAGWLEVDPLLGIIPANSEVILTASFDAGALDLGHYEALVTVNSWDDLHTLPVIEIPIDFYVDGIVSDLDLTMRSDESPVEVEAGGSFDFSLSVTNNIGVSTNYEGWTMVELPNHNMYGPLVRGNMFIDADETQYYTPTQNIPVSVPSGSYVYHSFVGDYPSDITDQASFPFEILSYSLGDDGARDWSISGLFSGNEYGRFGNENIPNEYSLSQNYPNPFNAHSVIKYALPEDGHVELSVFNLLGQKVETLIDSYQNGGYYSASWNASQYSSGVYFYRLDVNEKSFVKRMMLIK